MSDATDTQAWTLHTVSVKTSLAAADWTEVPYLRCTSVTRGAAPTLEQATLLWRFGTLCRQGETALAYVAKLDLRGKFVRVQAPDVEVDWVGYVVKEGYVRDTEETFDPGGGPEQRVSGGEQALVAVSLAYFLGRKLITYSVVYSGNRIERAIGYNTGMGDGRSSAYEPRGNKDSRGIAFAADFDHAEVWTGDAIATDLLTNYQPVDKDGNPAPVVFTLSGDAVDYLSWHKPILRTDGRSVLQALDDLADRRIGLTWWLTYSDLLGVAIVNVGSMATTDVSLPDSAVLPAATVSVALGEDPRLRCTIGRSQERRLGVVVCRGARRRAVCTISTASGNLQPSWKTTEESAYKTALGTDPVANDAYRQAERFHRVYTTFEIPQAWDGTSNNGATAPGGTDYCCPRPAQGSSSFGSGDLEKYNLYGVRLQRTMPIRAGWNYSDATAPVANDPDNLNGEFQQPFGVVDVDGEGTWRFLHRLGEGEGKFRNYSLAMLAGAAGLQIRPHGLPHAAAKNHFDYGGDAGAASKQATEVDYDKMRFTGCVEFDGYCEAQWPTTLPADAPLETHYVYIGNRARYDWLAANTIYDLDGSTLKTVTTGGALRDDRNLCETIAKIAHQWYSIDRAELVVRVSSTDIGGALLDVGDLITTVGSAEAAEIVNAVVSKITFNLEAGQAIIEAGFAELDFEALG